MSADRLVVTLVGCVLTLTLNLPDKRNAIYSAMVSS